MGADADEVTEGIVTMDATVTPTAGGKEDGGEVGDAGNSSANPAATSTPIAAAPTQSPIEEPTGSPASATAPISVDATSDVVLPATDENGGIGEGGGRGARKRTRRVRYGESEDVVEGLNKCLCGEVVPPNSAGSIHCRAASQYHETCVPPVSSKQNWHCEACGGKRGGKRQRR